MTWQCRTQSLLVRLFPQAATNIRLPLWAWKRLCDPGCSLECRATCRGCRELAAVGWPGFAVAAVADGSCGTGCGCAPATATVETAAAVETLAMSSAVDAQGVQHSAGDGAMVVGTETSACDASQDDCHGCC
jgi:hypothetical protein